MKKSIYRILPALLSALLLSGCAGGDTYREVWRPVQETPPAQTEASPESELVVFDQLVYERPDLQALEESVEAVKAALDGGEQLERVEELLDICLTQYEHYQTMTVLADIRNCQDLTDTYYAGEYRWCEEHDAEVAQFFDKLYYACAASPLALRLEEDFFWEGFTEDYGDESESKYSDEAVALMQEEGSLVAEYRELSANPVIEWDGGEVEYYALLDTLEGWNYFRAIETFYQQYNERFSDLYIRLVDVRSRLAAQQGYGSYEQMQYEYYYERDYSPAEAESYLENIRRFVVPFYKELMATEPYGDVWYDTVAEEMLYGVLQAGAGEIGGAAAEAFAFMSEYELYDISVSAKKAAMSFVVYLNEYHAPFLFLDASGDTGDILSMAHEFGHFTDEYVNDNAYETIDLAECYSQGMEYLILSRLGGTLRREDVDNIARLKMLDTVALYVQQAAFAEFESRVYALGAENLNAEVLSELSLRLAKDYGFFTPGYEVYYGMGWFDIAHFFEMPFYVITYPVSNDVAMQLYAMELAEEGSGMERYRKILERDFSGLMELVEAGHFESPFAEGRLEEAVSVMRQTFSAPEQENMENVKSKTAPRR